MLPRAFAGACLSRVNQHKEKTVYRWNTADSARSGLAHRTPTALRISNGGWLGVGLGDTMALSGQRSVHTVKKHYQSGEVANSRAARLMDDKEAE